MQGPDRRVLVRLEPAPRGPVRVLHPCRCDAPDPERARHEPLDVPLAPLLAEGRCLVICPECDYHLLAVVDGPRRQAAEQGRAEQERRPRSLAGTGGGADSDSTRM